MRPAIEVYGPMKAERFIYSDIARCNRDLEGVPVYRHTRIERPNVVSWQCFAFYRRNAPLSKIPRHN